MPREPIVLFEHKPKQPTGIKEEKLTARDCVGLKNREEKNEISKECF